MEIVYVILHLSLLFTAMLKDAEKGIAINDAITILFIIVSILDALIIGSLWGLLFCSVSFWVMYRMYLALIPFSLLMLGVLIMIL